MNPAKVSQQATEGNKLVTMVNNLINWHVLKRVVVCPSCSKAPVTLQTRQRTKDSSTACWTYRCSKCTKYHSAFDSSFFSLFRKPIEQLLLVIKFWSTGLTVAKAVDLFKLITNKDISPDFVGPLFRRLRNVCSVKVRKDKIMLGGRGKIVEIDEKSLLAKVKHNRGKDLKRKQVFMFS